MKIFHAEEIHRCIDGADIGALSEAIEHAFAAYSRGDTQVPSPGHLSFPEASGDSHIKYGHINGQPYFVIKIATGFYENHTKGLSSGHGMMSVWCASTGRLEALLLDDGLLTDIRTAIAGRIAAKYLAPRQVRRIGIVGCGVQAELQLRYLPPSVQCRDVLVWGRRQERLVRYKTIAERLGYNVEITTTLSDIRESCNLIVTTTPSKEPLIDGTLIPGTHITAAGSDGAGKRELGPSIQDQSSRWIVDSLPQCRMYGELSYAETLSVPISELGTLILDPLSHGRQSDTEITVADLTGLGVQDIAIACYVFEQLS